MNRVVPLAIVVSISAAASACAQQRVAEFREGTPIRLVGVVSSQPRDAGFIQEKKMQVAIGPNKTDYTLHLADAKLISFHGDEIGVSDFQDKMWVHAEGRVMDDPRRIDVTRVQVIGGNQQGYRAGRFYQKGHEHGYLLATGAPVTPREFAQDTPVVVVGRISSPPKGEINEQKMQVAVGPHKTDYTLHFSDAQVLGMQGQRLDEDGLDDGMWVRAEGRVMDDPRRIKVNRVQVIASDEPGVRRSAFFRPGLTHGYIMAVAGDRQTFPETNRSPYARMPVTVVGKVSDDTGALETTRKLQVQAAGNEWTLHVDDDSRVVDQKGEKISVHEIDEGQWIRATGWQTEDLRVQVTQIENIGRQEAFQGSRFFRAGEPLGYVERVAGQRGEQRTGRRADPNRSRRIAGTIEAVYPDRGYFVVRDARGRLHRVWADNADLMHQGRSLRLNELRAGDRVTVHGRMDATRNNLR